MCSFIEALGGPGSLDTIKADGHQTSEVKSKGEKERYKHLNAEFQRIARRDKKAFLSDQCTDGEALDSQKKQDQDLTVAQTMSSLLPDSDLN